MFSGSQPSAKKEDSREDDESSSEWEEEDSDGGEFLDLQDVIFVKGGMEDHYDSSSDDDFEIDDSFLDPDHKADLEEELKGHVAHPTGQGRG